MGTAQFSTNANVKQTPVSTVTVAKGDTVYLDYTPDANASGTNSLLLQIHLLYELRMNQGNYDTMQFSVIITPVNDPPVFNSRVLNLESIVVASGSTSIFHTLA